MHLKGIDYTWLHWKRRSCIFDPNSHSWTFSFDNSHLGWDLHILESFQGRGLNSVKHLVSMQRFWCVFPFPVFYFLFFFQFWGLYLIFLISFVIAHRRYFKFGKFQENGATLQTLKKKTDVQRAEMLIIKILAQIVFQISWLIRRGCRLGTFGFHGA